MFAIKKSKDTDYLALSACIHVLEGRLLNRERRERLIEAREDGDAIRILAECGYPELSAFTPDGLEAMLAQSQAELFRELSQRLPQREVLTLFQIREDYQNAKVLLKGAARGADTGRLLVSGGRYAPQRLAEDFRDMTLAEYSPAFQEAVAAARELLATSHDPQRVDFLLDRACWEEMLRAAQLCGSPFLVGYVQRMIDAINLRTAVRIRRNGQAAGLLEEALLPGGTVSPDTLASPKAEELAGLYRPAALHAAAELGDGLLRGEGSMTAFERACDNAVTDYVSAARRVPFGIETVVGYLHARQTDITALRTIFSGRMAGLPREVIRERLRESYG